MEGEKEIKIHGEMVPVRAEIHTIEAFSAHADYEEIFRWLAGFRRPPRMSSSCMANRADGAPGGEDPGTPGLAPHLPEYLEKVDLDALLPPMLGS